jgi:hypothetical protein
MATFNCFELILSVIYFEIITGDLITADLNDTYSYFRQL